MSGRNGKASRLPRVDRWPTLGVLILVTMIVACGMQPLAQSSSSDAPPITQDDGSPPAEPESQEPDAPAPEAVPAPDAAPAPEAAPAPAPPAASSAYSAAVLADQPLAYWRLGDAGGPALVDSSGQGQQATVQGNLTFGSAGGLRGDPDTGISLDGQTAFARDDTPIQVGSGFTIEAWVKAASGSQESQVISVLGGGASRNLYLQGGNFRGMDDVSSNWPTYAITSGSSFDVTAWHHVVFTTQGGTQLALYVDGTLAASSTVPSVPSFTGNAVLGWSDDENFRKFAGSLDEVALYPRALSADSVKAHFVAGGGVINNCTSSLQSQIDAAAPGSVVKVPGCIYREAITISKPLTLDGQGQAEVRGSDVWTGWNQSGKTWISSNTVPNVGTDSQGAEYSDAFRAAHLEQVFIDGSLLAQVPSNPADGQFALDPSRHVVIATNPAGHMVEVTTRTFWAQTGADNVTITNFTFRHAATSSQSHAIGNDNHSNFVLSNSTLTDAHGTLLSLGGGDTHAQVLNNTISRAGDLAIGAARSTNALIRGNTITDSGYGGWNWQWQAGGIKTVASTNLTVDSNTVRNNNGPGIWCDIACNGVTYSNNKVHDNTGPGILYEISTGAHIVGNAVWSNGAQLPGIYISNSADAEVANNTLAWNSIGVSVLSAQRPDSPPQGTIGNSIHDNIIVMRDSGAHAIEWLQYGPGKMFNSDGGDRGANNHFWYPADEDDHSVRFVWQQGFKKLSDFGGTPSGHSSDYLSAADRDRALAAAGIPTSP